MENLYNILRNRLNEQLLFLPDKPEENPDSTLKALWHKAAGNSFSAKIATEIPLPQLSVDQISMLEELIWQRIDGKPLAHITERQNFMGVEFIADKRALIPRKETEILANAAINLMQSSSADSIKVIDVCCGSGNVGLSLAMLLQNTIVHLADLSDEAVELTQQNIDFLKLNNKANVVKSDLFSSFESPEYYHQIDVITCNPPYISTAKVAKMNTEISENEPKMAFDGGMIGLKVIQKLISEAPKFLKPDAWVMFEIGIGQGPFLLKLLEENSDYDQVKYFSDENGNIRAFAAKKHTNNPKT
jgi:release factor glutamine methyltransferase